MVRTSNQDSFCALLAPDAPLGSDALLAVADGMGGRPAGEVASAMAIEKTAKPSARREISKRSWTTGNAPDCWVKRCMP